jgi:ketosteroid isomerase-like protein
VTSNADRAALLVRALRASLAGDRDQLDDLYTDDVKTWTPAHSTSSRRELVAELDRRDEAFSDVALEVTPLDVGGHHAAVEWRVTMTHSGPLRVGDTEIVEPTALRVGINGVTVAEFRDGRICALRQYWDELAVYDQLGLVRDHGEDEA